MDRDKMIKGIVCKVEELTGNDITDYLMDVYDDAAEAMIDYETIRQELMYEAERYINFIKENYPEDYNG